jgi:hypothetical protein
MSKVSAIPSVVREPCRINVLATDGDGVGRGVERGDGFAVGRGVRRAVGDGDCVGVSNGVAVRTVEAIGAGADGEGIGQEPIGAGAAETEAGAAGPQLDTTRVETSASHARARVTRNTWIRYRQQAVYGFSIVRQTITEERS